jgi:hypothetical protein
MATAGRMTGRFEHFDARPGGSYRLVRADAPTLVRAGKSAVGSDVVGRQGRSPRRRPIASTSGPTMCATGSTLQITRRDCRPRWTISPLPLNAERRLPRSHGARRYGDHPCRSDGGSVYGRQLQQAGDYTGPHRDPLTGHRDRSPTGCGRTKMLPADSPLRTRRSSRAPCSRALSLRARSDSAQVGPAQESPGLERWSPHQALSPEASPDFPSVRPFVDPRGKFASCRTRPKPASARA